MEYSTLQNGVKKPVAGFGVFQIPNNEVCTRAVMDAIDAGYRLIDTAQAYGNEEAVGKAIQQTTIPRDELFITTKVWINNAGYEKAKASIIDSLHKLQLDYVDLVLIHQPFHDYYGTYRAMIDLYKKGNIKAIGVSNFYPDRLADLCLYNDIPPAINQIEVNPFYQQCVAQETNKKYTVQVQAWAPFAQGKDDIFTNSTLLKIANTHKKSVAQVMLRWLFQRGIISLAKTTHKERMIENINIFDFTLDEGDMLAISTLDKNTSSFFDHRDVENVERLANLHPSS